MEKQDLIDILKEIHPEVDYETEKNLIDSKIFDSMDIVMLISEIADSFDIKIPANTTKPIEIFSKIRFLDPEWIKIKDRIAPVMAVSKNITRL